MRLEAQHSVCLAGLSWGLWLQIPFRHLCLESWGEEGGLLSPPYQATSRGAGGKQLQAAFSHQPLLSPWAAGQLTPHRVGCVTGWGSSSGGGGAVAGCVVPEACLATVTGRVPVGLTRPAAPTPQAAC